jgi:hypothetical protein
MVHIHRSNTPVSSYATIVGSALLGAALSMPHAEAQEPTFPPASPPTEPLTRRQGPGLPDLNVGPYLCELQSRPLSPDISRMLIEQGLMSTNTSGIVLDQKHFIFVSWDAQGVLFNKSAFREPCRSHSGLLALRTSVTASLSKSGQLSHSLRQTTSVISFLPDSVDAMLSHVRVDGKAFLNRDGVKGCNWQGLDFLFKPNKFILNSPMQVSATRLIPVSDKLYEAAIRQAALLDAQGKNYHVLSSARPQRDTENCITAIAGVLDQLPGTQRPLSTGPLRGQEATDYVARIILSSTRTSPSTSSVFEAPQDNWIIHEFLSSVPSARSDVQWYLLRRN